MRRASAGKFSAGAASTRISSMDKLWRRTWTSNSSMKRCVATASRAVITNERNGVNSGLASGFMMGHDNISFDGYFQAIPCPPAPNYAAYK